MTNNKIDTFWKYPKDMVKPVKVKKPVNTKRRGKKQRQRLAMKCKKLIVDKLMKDHGLEQRSNSIKEVLRFIRDNRIISFDERLNRNEKIIYAYNELLKGDLPIIPEVKGKCDATTDAFLSTYQWRKLRYQVILKYGRRCMCCGATPDSGVQIHVDHIKPRKKYPELALDIDNLQILCGVCNHGKGNWDQTDFREN